MNYCFDYLSLKMHSETLYNLKLTRRFPRAGLFGHFTITPGTNFSLMSATRINTGGTPEMELYYQQYFLYFPIFFIHFLAICVSIFVFDFLEHIFLEWRYKPEIILIKEQTIKAIEKLPMFFLWIIIVDTRGVDCVVELEWEYTRFCLSWWNLFDQTLCFNCWAWSLW